MRQKIEGFKKEYEDLLRRARSKLEGKWVRLKSSGERSAIVKVYISTHGVTFTLRTCSDRYLEDQRYGHDFEEW